MSGSLNGLPEETKEVPGVVSRFSVGTWCIPDPIGRPDWRGRGLCWLSRSSLEVVVRFGIGGRIQGRTARFGRYFWRHLE